MTPRESFTRPSSLVAEGIAEGEFDTMRGALAAALHTTEDEDFVNLAEIAGGAMLSVLAALQRLDVAATVLQEVGGLLRMGTSVASMLAHADDLETIVRSVANFASLTSILATGSEAAALAANFQAVGGHVASMHAAAPALVKSTASVFRVVQSLGNYSDVVNCMTALMGTAEQPTLTRHPPPRLKQSFHEFMCVYMAS